MFPREGIPHPGLQDNGIVVLKITSTQKISFPPGVTSIELWLQGGGASSSGGGVSLTQDISAGSAGACGMSVIQVSPSVEYTILIGTASIAPGAASSSNGTPGNDSMFFGNGILPITAQGGSSGAALVQSVAVNSQISIPGGLAMNVYSSSVAEMAAGGSSFFGGGGIKGSFALATTSAYGAGAAPPSLSLSSGLAGTNGNPGVAIIRYKGQA